MIGGQQLNGSSAAKVPYMGQHMAVTEKYQHGVHYSVASISNF